VLIQADVSVEPGDSFELWARRKSSATSIPSPAVTIFSDDRIVYRIAALPPYFQHFAHTHYSRETLRLEWDSDEIESSLFYRYNPATVRDEGITLLRLTDAGLETWPIDRLAKWYAAETGRPTLRFSPAQGWMNDPNGLCKLGDDYHLFYQFHPNGTDWGPMHWGHAVSRDLYRWTHLPVFVHPQQNLAALGATGGAFSGNAFFDRDGERQLALAWLFNWEFRKPAGSAYSGEMSLPRALSVNADRQLTMRPEPAYKTLRSERLVAEGGRFPIPNRPQAVELDIHGDLTDLHIVGRSSTGPSFTLRHQAGVLEIEVPEDLQGKITYRSTALDLTSLHLFFDRGVIEIFGNDGSVCGTRRTYRMDDLSQLEVQAKGLETMEAWQLASAWDDLVHR